MPHAARLSRLVFLIGATLAFHRALPRAGWFLTNSDYAVFSLLGQDFARSWSHWSAFPYQQDYGGTGMAVLRAAWLHFASVISGLSTDTGNLAQVFNYRVTPVINSLVLYGLARSLVSARAARPAAWVAAAGFSFWSGQYGNDFYFFSMWLCCALLALRARVDHPWREASPRGLILAGLTAGLAVYHWRAALVYVVAAAIPGGWVKGAIGRLQRPRGLMEHGLRGLVALLLLLYTVFQILGGNLGHIRGRPIHVHAWPNLQLAIIVLILWIIWVQRRDWSRSIALRWGAAGLGFILGFLPEGLARFRGLVPLPTGNPLDRTRFGDPYDHLWTGQLPRAFWQLVTGIDSPPGLKPEFYRGFENIAILTLVLGAIGILTYQTLHKKSDRRAGPAWMGMILTSVAYLSIANYADVPARYLFLFFPALFAGIALLGEYSAANRKLSGLLWVLVFTHVVYQVRFERKLVELAVANGAENNIAQVVKRFQSNGTRVVLTDSYWESNQYTLASDRKIYFISVGRDWGPTEGFVALRTESQHGVLCTGAIVECPAPPMPIPRDWRLDSLGSVGAISLFGAK